MNYLTKWRRTPRSHVFPSVSTGPRGTDSTAVARGAIGRQAARVPWTVHLYARNVCLGTLLLAAVLAAQLDSGRSRLALFLSGDSSLQISELPLVGDMRLTFNYPAYTGLDPRTIEGSDGRIETLKATQVVFEATADEEL